MSDYREIADRVMAHRTADVEVDELALGPGTVLNAHVRVFGKRVTIGRQGWLDQYAVIGGGSAHDELSFLEAGDWLHCGMFSQVNTARGVKLGHEVGIGISTRVFSHGAYLSEWEGFPVSFRSVEIGSRVWLPNAQVNPGSAIGDDCVVAAGSVVSGSFPEGCLIAGNPAKVIKAKQYPRPLAMEERRHWLELFRQEVADLYGIQLGVSAELDRLVVGDTTFWLDHRQIDGPCSDITESIRNQLRRRGIRFAYDAVGGAYLPWT